MTSYSFASRCFHWLTAVLVLAAFVQSPGGPEERVFGAANRDSLTLHESLGLAVFVTTLLRLAHRAWAPAPAPVAMPAWMHWAAGITRWLLYFLLAFIPLSAIFGSWMGGHALSFYFGGIASPWATSQTLGQTALALHKQAGDAIMWLAGLHAAAALYHHFILKDGVLRSMLVAR